MFFFLCFSRRTGDGASRESSDDYTELNRPQNPAAILTQNLVVEIRQAVNENQPKGILLILFYLFRKKNKFSIVKLHYLVKSYVICVVAVVVVCTLLRVHGGHTVDGCETLDLDPKCH